MISQIIRAFGEMRWSRRAIAIRRRGLTIVAESGPDAVGLVVGQQL